VSETTCEQCGKPIRTLRISTPFEGMPFDYDNFCTGYHPTMPINALHKTLGTTDLIDIRDIVRSELERFVEEQERKMEELFRPKEQDNE